MARVAPANESRAEQKAQRERGEHRERGARSHISEEIERAERRRQPNGEMINHGVDSPVKAATTSSIRAARDPLTSANTRPPAAAVWARSSRNAATNSSLDSK